MLCCAFSRTLSFSASSSFTSFKINFKVAKFSPF
jgi:hypothetical protein